MSQEHQHHLMMHLNPVDREPFWAGYLGVVPKDIAQVTLGQNWDAWDGHVDSFRAQAISPYHYYQFATWPPEAWGNGPPVNTTRQQLEPWRGYPSWAMGRELIDWPNAKLRPFANALAVALRSFQGTHLFLDNYFFIQPWMLRVEHWSELAGIPLLKLQAWDRKAVSLLPLLVEELGGHELLLNGTYVTGHRHYIERAAARRAETELLVASRDAAALILSIPAHETWNLQWAFDLWLANPGLTLAFTADNPAGVASPESVHAYQRAVEERRRRGTGT